MNPENINFHKAIEEILQTRICASHADIKRELAKRDIILTQATISRRLNRMGAIKTLLPDGRHAYRLHKGTVTYRDDAGKLSRNTIAQHMAERIIANGTAIVILGKPDSGRYLGTFVDDAALPHVAGTIAGGNTLLVLPLAHKHYSKTCDEVRLLFPQTPFHRHT